MPVQHIQTSKKRIDRLVTWLDENLQKVDERRIQRNALWRGYREQYEGGIQETKNFPWKGASNVYVPLTAIYTDAIHANMMNRIFGHERIWDISSMHPTEVVGQNTETGQPINWADLAKEAQVYLNFEGSKQGMMDFYESCGEAILECIKLGTAVIHMPWQSIYQRNFKWDYTLGEILKDEPTKVFDGIRPQMIPLEDFIILPHYAELTGPFGSPIIGHNYWLRAGEINRLAKQGQFKGGEGLQKVLGSPGHDVDDDGLKDHQTMLEKDPDTIRTLRRDDYHLKDLWIKFDLNEDGIEENLFVTYHRPTGTILRLQPWIYKTPPYTALRYIKREGRFYGIGVPEVLRSMQAGVNTSFNQAVDNATIANMRCIKIKAGQNSALIRSLNDIYPGKKFIVNNMDDLDAFQLGEVYPSIFQVGLLLRDFAERRTGISDFNLGRESEALGRASTATTTMALLQESSRRFDLYAKDIRRAISEMGMQALELIQQYKPIERMHLAMGSKGSLVERALVLPEVADVRMHLKVIATSAASSANKEASRQNSLAAFGLYMQFSEKLTQMAMAIINPQLPPGFKNFLNEVGNVGERIVRNAFESYEMPELAEMLPQLERLLSEAQPPGGNGTPIVGPQPGNPGGAAPGLQGAVPPGAAPPALSSNLE